MKLEIKSFKGLVPKIDTRLLPPEIATTAKNCRFDRGVIDPIKTGLSSGDSVSSLTESLFLYAGAHWLNWTKDVDVVRSPINQDDYERIYFTQEDGKPQITYNTIATGGGALPTLSYDLGVPAPEVAVGIVNTIFNGQNEDDFSDDETRFYVCTFVTALGEEGPTSPLSTEVEILNKDARVNLTIPVMGVNAHNVNHVRVYRSETSGTTSDFVHVADVPHGTTTFQDTLKNEQLGGLLSTVTYDPPPEDMRGLTALPNGILAGFTGNTLCFSEAYLPYAWPINYQLTTEHDIVAMASTGNSLVVATKGYPYLVSGVSPDGMTAVKLEINQSCLSKQSLVDMGEYVLYASPDGLVAASSGGVRVITEKLMSREQWQEKYKPDTLRSFHWEGMYLGFYNGDSGFIFDPRTQSLIDLDMYAEAGYNDLETDTLYLSVGGSLVEWGNNTTTLDYTWSKIIDLDSKPSLSAMRIEVEGINDVLLKIKTDGNEVLNLPTPPETFRLPAVRCEQMEISVSGTAPIRRMVLASSMREL